MKNKKLDYTKLSNEQLRNIVDEKILRPVDIVNCVLELDRREHITRRLTEINTEFGKTLEVVDND